MPDKLYYIIVHPTPAYWRHFTLLAETPMRALHKLNYYSRQQVKILQERLQYLRTEENSGKVWYHNETTYAERNLFKLTEVVKTLRRWKRRYKDVFAHENTYAVTIQELPSALCYEGHLSHMFHDHQSGVWNVFPKILLNANVTPRRLGGESKE